MKIRAEHVLGIEEHARRGYPDEECGVLVGQRAAEVAVEMVIPVANREREAPRIRYQIAPEDLLRIQRESRESHKDVVGFYHSHPDHPARPSETAASETEIAFATADVSSFVELLFSFAYGKFKLHESSLNIQTNGDQSQALGPSFSNEGTDF